jgi:hypothetical protein
MNKKYYPFFLSCLFFTNILKSKYYGKVTSFVNSTTPSSHHLLNYWFVHKPFDEHHYSWSFTTTIELLKTFRSERIVQCFFGDATLDNKSCIVISGSQTNNRNNNPIITKCHEKKCYKHAKQKCNYQSFDWLSDYFLLPNDYKSIVNFRPRVDSILIHLHNYINTDNLIPHTFIEIHLPLEHTTWNMYIDENIQDHGINNHTPGYFTPQELNRENLFCNFKQFINGSSASDIDNLTFIPLKYSKISCKNLHKTSLSTLSVTGFWQFLQRTHATITAELNWKIPTESKLKGEYLFEPIVGNGRHTELGIALASNVRLSHNQEKDRTFVWFARTHVMHLFDAKDNHRSFNLKNKPNSRYMLAQQLTTDIQNNLQGNNINANKQFNAIITPVANLTTLKVDIGIKAQLDFSTYFALYQKDNQWLFGYRYRTRSCDDICVVDDYEELQKNNWALKGDVQVYGFANDDAIALSATQNRATINYGKNFPPNGTTNKELISIAQQNNTIDNPQLATTNNQPLTTQPNGTKQIKTSIQSHILSIYDIDLESAQTGETTHTIFTYLQCNWNRTNADPFVAMGAEFILGNNAQKTSFFECDDCLNTAFSSWHFYVKAGFSFK